MERSETLQQLFTDHLADFTAFDPDLNATFNTNWLAAIEAAVTATNSETVDDEMQLLTQATLQAMVNCQRKYIEVKYYFGKAFPGNKPVMKEMGTDDYKRARERQMRMVFFMDNLFTKASKYKVQLIAKGYTQPKIDEIDTLRQALQAANKAQNAFSKGRPVLSQERENIYNACYNFTRQVCDAADSVYYDNEVLQKLFVFEPSGGDSSEFFEGTVPKLGQIMVDDFSYDAGRNFKMQNTGTVALSFFFSLDANNPVGNTHTVNPGETLEKTSADFHTEGTSLIVKNPNADTEGSYEVEEFF